MRAEDESEVPESDCGHVATDAFVDLVRGKVRYCAFRANGDNGDGHALETSMQWRRVCRLQAYGGHRSAARQNDLGQRQGTSWNVALWTVMECHRGAVATQHRPISMGVDRCLTDSLLSLAGVFACLFGTWDGHLVTGHWRSSSRVSRA